MRCIKSLHVVVLFLLLSACGGQGKPAVIHNDAQTVAEAVSPTTITVLEPEILKENEIEQRAILAGGYHLGDEVSGQMSFPISGYLAVPEVGDNLPLVLILHGNHGADSTKAQFYQGFSYLADHLAGRGYAAASLDIQSAYATQYGSGDDDEKTAIIAARQLDYFMRANGGESLFPMDLTNRLNMDRIIVVGHSRGGDVALELACSWDNVAGVCAVAPNLRIAEKAWRDVTAAILVPQLDGDVDTLDGYAYLWPRWKADLERPTVLTLLEGGNHNFFNTVLNQDDASVYGGAKLTPKEQQAFLCRYLADFCDAVTTAETEVGADRVLSAYTDRYGFAVRELSIQKSLELLTDTEQGAAASKGCEVRRITVDKRTADIHIPLSWGTDQTLTFWEGTWNEPQAVMEVPLLRGDLSGYQALTLDSVMVKETEGLMLVLTDEMGGSVGVRIPPVSPSQAGSEYSVFSQIRIPLSNFQGLDMQRIVRVSLLADSGQLWLSALWGEV